MDMVAMIPTRSLRSTSFISVTKFIRIGIADKNDNPPYFDKTLYEAEVDENEDIQHTVLTVTAKDQDECKSQLCNLATEVVHTYIQNISRCNNVKVTRSFVSVHSISHPLRDHKRQHWRCFCCQEHDRRRLCCRATRL